MGDLSPKTIWRSICQLFSCDYWCTEKMCKQLADEASKALEILEEAEEKLKQWESYTPWPD